ncbi:MAG: potassium channel family protein [Gammaproteobacteria bacterium]|jgi:trk system potassium uptake protein TrkA
MRAVFIGSTPLSTMAAQILLQRGHEVVIVERDKARIDTLAEELSCGFLHGDGTRPDMLKEADPAETDWLYCLTHNDQTNIIASLVGKSLGFGRVVTRIEDPQFEHICLELGLENTIIPARTIGSFLADSFDGRSPLTLSAMIRGVARPFTFVARADDTGPMSALDLPSESRVVCLYRNDKVVFPESDTAVVPDDEVFVITHEKNLTKLSKRWPG